MHRLEKKFNDIEIAKKKKKRPARHLCIPTNVLLCTVYDSAPFKSRHFYRGFPQNILENFEIESMRDALWFTVPSHSSSFFYFVCSLSSSLFLVHAFSFSAFASPKGTKESVAAGHTGGLEHVLLFRPWWCLLCKMCRGGRLV